MANPLRDAVQFLHTTLRDINNVEVTLRRDGFEDTTGVKARIASDRESTDEYGHLLSGADRDFVILATDYAFAETEFTEGEVLDPEVGDKILVANPNLGTDTYEVRSDGADAFENSDNFGFAWRIHTIKV